MMTSTMTSQISHGTIAPVMVIVWIQAEYHTAQRQTGRLQFRCSCLIPDLDVCRAVVLSDEHEVRVNKCVKGGDLFLEGSLTPLLQQQQQPLNLPQRSEFASLTKGEFREERLEAKVGGKNAERKKIKNSRGEGNEKGEVSNSRLEERIE